MAYIRNVRLGDVFITNTGVVTKVIAVRVGERRIELEDSHLNTAWAIFSEVITGRFKWPVEDEYLDKFRPVYGRSYTNTKGDGYRIISMRGNDITVIWEKHGNKVSYNVADVGNNTLTNTFQDHYVYVATYNDEIVYIGKGTENRFAHCNSGVSSCYEMNKIHFEGGRVDVEIAIRNLSSEDAFKREAEMIRECQPKFNKTLLF